MGVREESGSRLSELFEVSPEVEAHTSAAAELSLLLGLAALLASPFSMMFAVSGGVALLGAFFAMVGLATTSRPGTAGAVLVALGLLFSLGALAVLGLRYLGIDTAVGDDWMPRLLSALEFLNTQLPHP